MKPTIMSKALKSLPYTVGINWKPVQPSPTLFLKWKNNQLASAACAHNEQ